LTSVFHASALLLIMNVVIIKLSNQGSVGSRSLTHHISYKFICLSTYWQWKSANERVRISAVIVKYTVHRFDPNIADHLTWSLMFKFPTVLEAMSTGSQNRWKSTNFSGPENETHQKTKTNICDWNNLKQKN